MAPCFPDVGVVKNYDNHKGEALHEGGVGGGGGEEERMQGCQYARIRHKDIFLPGSMRLPLLRRH